MQQVTPTRVTPAIAPSRLVRRTALLGGCALLTALCVRAQTPQESPIAGTDTLEEVVVTAQKRSETILTVPIAITALGAEALEQRGIKDLNDIARATPSLNITSNNGLGYSNVSIRGIASATGAATTGVYIDDTPIQQRNDSLGPPLAPQVFDLERVEVLRGPQGTLYGAGAEGGAIRFITPGPSFDKASLRVRGEAAFTDGGDATWEAGVAGGAPLIDGTLGFRAGAWYRHQGGYIDRVSRYTGAVVDGNSNSSANTAARLALGWKPIDGLTITPSVFYQHTKVDDADLYWKERPRFQSEAKVAQPNDDKWTLSTLTVDYALSVFSVRSITSYMSRKNFQINDWSYIEPSQLSAIGIPGTASAPGDIDVPGAPDWTAAMVADIDQEVFSQELRFTSTGGADARISWVGGLYFSHNRLHRVRNEFEDLDVLTGALFGIPAVAFFGVPSLPGPVGYAENTTNTEKETAAFGNVSYRFSAQWQLTLGARLARTEFDSSNFQDGPWNAGPGLASGTRKDTPFTPKLNLTYNPTPDNMVYASVAKGYRVGGGNASYANNFVCQIDLQGADAPAVYKSDSVWSYELGTKNKLAGGRADVSASVFRIDWSDIQSLIFMPTCGNIYTDNLGKAVSQGGDLELHAQVVHGLTLSVSAGYTDAHYVETTTRVFGTGPVTLAQDGQKLPIPKVSGSAALYYERALSGSGREGYLNLTWDYAGSYERNAPAGVFGADPSTSHADAVQSLSARLGARLGAFDVSVFADNLTNAHPELLRYHETTLSTVFRGRTLRPRTLGLTATYLF
jgi:iron complex outermembrane receptor protein